MLIFTLNLCRFKSDERTLADSLDYEKVETKKLREEKEDLLKKLQEANSAAQKLQEEINSKCWTWNCLECWSLPLSVLRIFFSFCWFSFLWQYGQSRQKVRTSPDPYLGASQFRSPCLKRQENLQKEKKNMRRMDKGKNQHSRQFQVQHLLFISSCKLDRKSVV